MLMSHEDFSSRAKNKPSIPTHRFNFIESPLNIAARSAGFDTWENLATAVMAGQIVTVRAPEIYGDRPHGLGRLFQIGCEEFGITVIGMVTGPDGQVYLALAADLAMAAAA